MDMKKSPVLSNRGSLVREGGVEPPRPHGHTDLNRARLPIPPLAREAGLGYPTATTAPKPGRSRSPTARYDATEPGVAAVDYARDLSMHGCGFTRVGRGYTTRRRRAVWV